jgi:hypothetical protein
MAVGTMTSLLIGGALLGGALATRDKGGEASTSARRGTPGRGNGNADGVTPVNAQGRTGTPGRGGTPVDGPAQARTRNPDSQVVGTAQPREGASNTVGSTNPPDATQDAQNASQAARIAAIGTRRRAAGFNQPLMGNERSSITPPKARLNRRTLVGF